MKLPHLSLSLPARGYSLHPFGSSQMAPLFSFSKDYKSILIRKKSGGGGGRKIIRLSEYSALRGEGNDFLSIPPDCLLCGFTAPTRDHIWSHSVSHLPSDGSVARPLSSLELNTIIFRCSIIWISIFKRSDIQRFEQSHETHKNSFQNSFPERLLRDLRPRRVLFLPLRAKYGGSVSEFGPLLGVAPLSL